MQQKAKFASKIFHMSFQIQFYSCFWLLTIIFGNSVSKSNKMAPENLLDLLGSKHLFRKNWNLFSQNAITAPQKVLSIRTSKDSRIDILIFIFIFCVLESSTRRLVICFIDYSLAAYSSLPAYQDQRRSLLP